MNISLAIYERKKSYYFATFYLCIFFIHYVYVYKWTDIFLFTSLHEVSYYLILWTNPYYKSCIISHTCVVANVL